MLTLMPKIPEEARKAFDATKVSFDAHKTGRTDVIQGVQAEERGHAAVAQAISRVAAFRLGADKTAVAQAAEVVRDVGLAEAGRLHDLGDGQRPLPENLQNGETRGIREAPKELRRQADTLRPRHGKHGRTSSYH